jgi:hypothetical protein
VLIIWSNKRRILTDFFGENSFKNHSIGPCSRFSRISASQLGQKGLFFQVLSKPAMHRNEWDGVTGLPDFSW